MRSVRSSTAGWLAAAAVAVTAVATVLSGGAVQAAQSKIVIDVWLADYPFPGYLEPRKRMAAEFNAAHPRYEVRVQGHFFADLPKAVRQAVRDGDPPDVANYYYNATQIARDMRAANGRPLFTSVEKAIGGRTRILGEPVVLKDVVPAFRDYYTFRGDTVSMPLTAMTSLVFGNRTMLAAAGVTRMPRTWRELEAACAKIAELPDAPEHCVTWPDHNWFFQQALAQQGETLVNRQNGRAGRATHVNVLSKEMLTYVRWWKRMQAKGYYLYTGKPEDWGGNFQAFTGERVAFVYDSANTAAVYAQAGGQAGFEVEAGRLPYNGDVRPSGNVSSGDSLWLAAGLDRRKRDGALAFMQYLDSPRNAAEWHKSSGYLPMTRPGIALLDREGWFGEHPAVRTALDQIGAADRSPAGLGAVTGDFQGIQNELLTAMDDVLARDADPVRRFARATLSAQWLLTRYNTRCTRNGHSDPECVRVGAAG